MCFTRNRDRHGCLPRVKQDLKPETRTFDLIFSPKFKKVLVPAFQYQFQVLNFVLLLADTPVDSDYK